MEQNREPETGSGKCSQLIFDKGVKAIQLHKDNLFNKWCQNSWTCLYKKMNLDTDLALFTKMNSKWITDLNVKGKAMKLEDSVGENLGDFKYGDDV